MLERVGWALHADKQKRHGFFKRSISHMRRGGLGWVSRGGIGGGRTRESCLGMQQVCHME